MFTGVLYMTALTFFEPLPFIIEAKFIMAWPNPELFMFALKPFLMLKLLE